MHLESLAFPPLSELLRAGREGGLVRLFACSASCRLLGLDLMEAQSRVDAILGWQSFSDKIAQAGRVVTL